MYYEILYFHGCGNGDSSQFYPEGRGNMRLHVVTTQINYPGLILIK
jgi:hypothetical protein